ncbi:hypothetical protein [Nocardia mangyaensis]|uniref:hypothetical protein n=1 Tax=Nocardia mangyaensis TaxID=2213200 RepID=UPI0026750370|nr:hypothetical protein [Nocardia mangyaensis]MDO3646833.1 hypothetical protein [Nocardia mangyaensis]
MDLTEVAVVPTPYFLTPSIAAGRLVRLVRRLGRRRGAVGGIRSSSRRHQG